MNSQLALLGLAVCVFTAATARAADSPISLSEAVRVAIAHNPDLEAAVIAVKSSEQSVTYEDARYPFLLGLEGGLTNTATPYAALNQVSVSNTKSIDLGASLSKHLVYGTDLSLSLKGNWQLGGALTYNAPTSSTVDTPLYGLSLRANVTQPLLRGAGREVGEATLNQARAQQTSAEASREREASSVLKAVVEAYWELWYASESLTIERSSLALIVQQRDEAKKRVDTGGLAPADLLAFETRRMTQEEAVSNADLDRRLKSRALLASLGQAELKDDLSPQEALQEPSPPPPDAAARAELASAEIAEAQKAIVVAEIQAKTAADVNRARLDLDGYVQTQGLGNDSASQALAQFSKLGVLSAHVGLTFETPLTSSQRRAAEARARLAVDSAKAKLASVRQNVLANVASEIAREDASTRRIELAVASAAAAQTALSAESARLGTGSSTPLSVLEAERDLRAAKLRVLRAKVDRVEAASNLDHLLGRLITKYGVERAAAANNGPPATRKRLHLLAKAALY
jgi:outer membrane protein TolC